MEVLTLVCLMPMLFGLFLICVAILVVLHFWGIYDKAKEKYDQANATDIKH